MCISRWERRTIRHRRLPQRIPRMTTLVPRCPAVYWDFHPLGQSSSEPRIPKPLLQLCDFAPGLVTLAAHLCERAHGPVAISDEAVDAGRDGVRPPTAAFATLPAAASHDMLVSSVRTRWPPESGSGQPSHPSREPPSAALGVRPPLLPFVTVLEAHVGAPAACRAAKRKVDHAVRLERWFESASTSSALLPVEPPSS
jgi:hypothetical protein